MDAGPELERLARVNTPFIGWPVRQETAMQGYESVLAKSGATRPRRDPVDARVVDRVRTNKVLVRGGFVHDPAEVRGIGPTRSRRPRSRSTPMATACLKRGCSSTA